MKAPSKKAQSWANQFIKHVTCPECNGARLKMEALAFYRLNGKNITELTSMDIGSLKTGLTILNTPLAIGRKQLPSEIIKEVRTRLGFMLDVGLNYLSLT